MAPASQTLKAVLDSGAEYLTGKGVEHARLACELLAARLLRCPRLELCLKYGEILPEKHLEAMRRGVKRVAAGEPVQYVIGETGFMGHTFKVDRRCLIPRPETEGLVEKVLACEPLWRRPKPAVVEIGTGSGCIVISLALARPDALYIGLDTSADALAVAAENADALGAAGRIAFTSGEMADFLEPGTVDAIVANLPYVPTADYEKLPVSIRHYEPRVALDGGPDGLAVIGPVVQDAALVLKPGGYLFLEIGERQAGAVTSLARAEGFEDTAVAKDAAGKDRIFSALLGAGPAS